MEDLTRTFGGIGGAGVRSRAISVISVKLAPASEGSGEGYGTVCAIRPFGRAGDERECSKGGKGSSNDTSFGKLRIFGRKNEVSQLGRPPLGFSNSESSILLDRLGIANALDASSKGRLASIAWYANNLDGTI